MSNLLPERYKNFDDLPDHIKAAIKRCEVRNVDSFINYKIPGMGYRSVLDMMNREGQEGERHVLEYIQRYDADRR
jgi:hypothetical protein